MKTKYCFLTLLLALFCIPGFSQELTDAPIDFSLQVKNMHLLRGQQVTNAALADVDIHVFDKNKMFKAGLWGAASFNGVYREFDYYVSFEKAGFSIALWDIYNFSTNETGWNHDKVFNYSARETGHFLDLAVAYQFQGKFPLKISWATVLFGRDRGGFDLNTKNRYSTYVSLDCPVLRHHVVNLDFGIAGAFALDKYSGTKANFYGDTAGIVNVNMTASKVLNIGKFKLPVSAMAMWNPMQNIANIQVAFDLF
ncbi:hypothetical protein Bcop_0567 [Bacteroides coprosuis DSM 18011]|uniref:Uncharacterized protein n=1 Tax=Bacteroides coprosuis DSM 18011 TaxID=679937 RepID=F3ZRX9_9BACE|nr:hypothetical protein [Bacteroides coprosuis]EGJ70785.1 hypothetical protein Bcop_0567 [Bacteroides coprosuis DSM 18011]